MPQPDPKSPEIFGKIVDAMLRRSLEDRGADGAAIEIRRICEIPLGTSLDPVFVAEVVRAANAPRILPSIPQVV